MRLSVAEADDVNAPDQSQREKLASGWRRGDCLDNGHLLLVSFPCNCSGRFTVVSAAAAAAAAPNHHSCRVIAAPMHPFVVDRIDFQRRAIDAIETTESMDSGMQTSTAPENQIYYVTVCAGCFTAKSTPASKIERCWNSVGTMNHGHNPTGQMPQRKKQPRTKCHTEKKTPRQNATQEMNGRTKYHWRTDSLSLLVNCWPYVTKCFNLLIGITSVYLLNSSVSIIITVRRPFKTR